MTEAVASSQRRFSLNFPNNSLLQLFPEVPLLTGHVLLISEFTTESLESYNLTGNYIIIT